MTTHEQHENKHAKAAPAELCECTIPPHVSNCHDCFGFGVVRVLGDKHSGYRPRRASEAMGATPSHPAAPCPTCDTGVSIEGYGPATLMIPVTTPVTPA